MEKFSLTHRIKYLLELLFPIYFTRYKIVLKKKTIRSLENWKRQLEQLFSG